MAVVPYYFLENWLLVFWFKESKFSELYVWKETMALGRLFSLNYH